MHRWPIYEVAPDDSVYALGIVSINYARFERTHVWMLAAVANMTEAQASIINARTNPSARAEFIRTFMERREWPAEASAAISHYLSAMNILNQSRNVLIHSNMIRGTDNRTAFYSMSHQGTTNLFQATLDEIRQVADDLNTYFYFGLNLANYIATDIHHMAREAGMLVISQVPPLPPLPVHIHPGQRAKR